MRIPKRKSQTTRASLLGRLKDWNDQESWRAFFEKYWRLIYSFAVRSGLNDAEAQDVVQETFVELAHRLKEFEYDPKRGSFKSWLLRLTAWRVADQRRRRRAVSDRVTDREQDDERTPSAEPSSSDQDRIWDEEWEQNLVATALEATKALVSERQFQLFDCHVMKEWPVEKVCQTLKVNRAQVYLAKHRVTRVVEKELRRLRTEMENTENNRKR